jgi:hypothetical protein
VTAVDESDTSERDGCASPDSFKLTSSSSWPPTLSLSSHSSSEDVDRADSSSALSDGVFRSFLNAFLHAGTISRYVYN